jgi:hypothetical protein
LWLGIRYYILGSILRQAGCGFKESSLILAQAKKEILITHPPFLPGGTVYFAEGRENSSQAFRIDCHNDALSAV